MPRTGLGCSGTLDDPTAELGVGVGFGGDKWSCTSRPWTGLSLAVREVVGEVENNDVEGLIPLTETLGEDEVGRRDEGVIEEELDAPRYIVEAFLL